MIRRLREAAAELPDTIAWRLSGRRHAENAIANLAESLHTAVEIANANHGETLKTRRERDELVKENISIRADHAVLSNTRDELVKENISIRAERDEQRAAMIQAQRERESFDAQRAKAELQCSRLLDEMPGSPVQAANHVDFRHWPLGWAVGVDLYGDVVSIETELTNVVHWIDRSDGEPLGRYDVPGRVLASMRQIHEARHGKH